MRALHFAWRFSRGLKVDVRVLALDSAGAVLLAASEGGWRLPGGTIAPGESAPAAARCALAATGATGGALTLHRLYRVAAEPHLDHVALYIARGAVLSDSAGAKAAFFAPGALPGGTEPASRRRIAAVLCGAPEDEVW
ncbi:MAG TPA: NUDIX domain-containing protein [Xanthobacteraceae bacterium]|nr:NUDIX domain-containing protein [Xanthobacteraceae bacterium]